MLRAWLNLKIRQLSERRPILASDILSVQNCMLNDLPPVGRSRACSLAVSGGILFEFCDKNHQVLP